MREKFREELLSIFKKAKKDNKESIIVISGDLHRKVGGYPGRNHRMPTCCSVMMAFKRSQDEILNSPPKGKGATLKIKYYL